ncbi:hypothetical protein MO867_20225 [Microbulbifer sp. OS29]|uniref:DUF5666 domain-containing protein n=1 Tax=Microbulbifer okhotskensis TaxID=2926617 RepID=A0A9X2ERV5_9GAMM|nr:hypothetical protein [Microbulbifer okhotskensis]MCO1336656.1 hypothetical protein [Microbulbifer okhotskensis]
MKTLPLALLLSLSSFAIAEETVTGVLEEEISENFQTGEIDRRFSLKDENTGEYYFIDAQEIKEKGMKSGERVRIHGERENKRRFRIRESQRLELRREE